MIIIQASRFLQYRSSQAVATIIAWGESGVSMAAAAVGYVVIIQSEGSSNVVIGILSVVKLLLLLILWILHSFEHSE